MKTPVLLPIALITPLAPPLRVRIQENDEIIERYSEQMESMDDVKNFPPVEVFFDENRYWLADGYHRLEAAKRAGHDFVWACINVGTPNDAFGLAIAANGKHGLHLSRTDRKRIVEIVVREWPDRSNRLIADQIGISEKTVSRVRNELAQSEALSIPEKRQGLDGKMYPSRKNNCISNRLQQQNLHIPVQNVSLPESEKKPASIANEHVSDSNRLIEFAFEFCPNDIETVFLGLFDEIIRRSGKDIGKKLMKSIFDKIVGLRD